MQTKTTEGVSGYVLVGGASSRMGRSKPQISFNGAKLFERPALALMTAFPNIVTLVGTGADELAKSSDLQLNAIPDTSIETANGKRAAIIGIYSALRNSKTRWSAILACDLPFVTGSLMRNLAARVSDDADAIVPWQADGRPQPLCAIYNTANCIPVIEEMLRSGNLKMQLLLSRLTVDHVPFAEIEMLAGSQEFFLNVNSPVDLEIARRTVHLAAT